MFLLILRVPVKNVLCNYDTYADLPVDVGNNAANTKYEYDIPAIAFAIAPVIY